MWPATALTSPQPLSFYAFISETHFLRCRAISSKTTCYRSVLSFPKRGTCSSFHLSYLKNVPEGACLSALVCPSPSNKHTMASHSPAERLCQVLSKPIYLLHAVLRLRHKCRVWVVASLLFPLCCMKPDLLDIVSYPTLPWHLSYNK